MRSDVLFAPASRMASVSCVATGSISTKKKKHQLCRSREGGNPCDVPYAAVLWIPAFAGMTRVVYGALRRTSALKSRQLGKLFLPTMHMHAAELSAAMQRGHRLTGIEQSA